MALIECPECKREVSDKAPTCPHCGVAIAGAGLHKPEVPRITKKRPVVGPILLLLLIVVGAGLIWLWRAATSEKAAPTSAGPAASLRQPKKLVDERIQLKEGQYIIYSFVLYTDSRVQVQIAAEPKHVDVMLMTKAEAEKFRDVTGNLFGGKYTYRQALSGRLVLKMDKTEILPQGEWSIVVMRPSETLLFGKETAATVTVTAY